VLLLVRVCSGNAFRKKGSDVEDIALKRHIAACVDERDEMNRNEGYHRAMNGTNGLEPTDWNGMECKWSKQRY